MGVVHLLGKITGVLVGVQSKVSFVLLVPEASEASEGDFVFSVVSGLT